VRESTDQTIKRALVYYEFRGSAIEGDKVDSSKRAGALFDMDKFAAQHQAQRESELEGMGFADGDQQRQLRDSSSLQTRASVGGDSLFFWTHSKKWTTEDGTCSSCNLDKKTDTEQKGTENCKVDGKNNDKYCSNFEWIEGCTIVGKKTLKDFDDLLGCKNTDSSEFVKAGEMLTAKVNSIPGCATNNNGKIVFKDDPKRTERGDYDKKLGVRVRAYKTGCCPGIPYREKKVAPINKYNVAWKHRKNPKYISICPAEKRNNKLKWHRYLCFRTAAMMTHCNDGTVNSVISSSPASYGDADPFRGWCCDQNGANCKVSWSMVDGWWREIMLKARQALVKKQQA